MPVLLAAVIWFGGCGCFAGGHVVAEGYAGEVEDDEGDAHEEHAAGVGGGEEHGEDRDDEDGDSPFFEIDFDGKDVDSLEEEHHEGELEADAEAEWEEEDEAHPFADLGGGVDAHLGVEPEEEIEDVIEDDEKGEGCTGEEEAEAHGEEDVDVLAFVLVESGGDEIPDEVENEGASQHRADDERGFDVDHEGFVAGKTDEF